MGTDSEKGRYTTPEGSSTWEYISTVSCAILVLGIGTVAGWNSPTSVKLMNSESPVPMDHSEMSTLAAMTALGHTFAPPLTIFLVDTFGRKNTLLISGCPLAIGWTMIVFARHAMVLYVARFICGLSIGLGFTVCPMYLGEIASTKLRGAISMLMTVMFNMGILFMFGLAPYVSIQTAASVCLVITVIFLASFSFMPDSPYFLVMVKKFDEAEAALEKLRGKTDIEEEMDLIKLTINKAKPVEVVEKLEDGADAPKPSALKLIYSVKGNRRAMGIIMMFVIVHYFGGYLTFMVYGHVVFADMNTPVSVEFCTIMLAVIQLVTVFATTFVVDRLGRRPLVFASGVVGALCLLTIGVYFYLSEYLNLSVVPYSTIPLIATFVLEIALNFGFIPLQFVVTSEVFHTDVKALASCILIVIGGILGSISMKAYILICKSWELGHSVPFFGFSIILSLCTVTLMWILPETKGKTFLEIQHELNA